MDEKRFEAVLAAVDAANSDDPRVDVVEGEEVPAELLYARRMSERLALLYPNASETLRIAARAQHIRRWTMPRSAYPNGRAGYHAWRIACRAMHAETVGQMMADQGYDREAIEQVGKIIRKEELKSDPDSQRLQNVVGVVFIEHYLDAFAGSHSEDKLVGILKKTARKMDTEGLAVVETLDLEPRLSDLMAKAIA